MERTHCVPVIRAGIDGLGVLRDGFFGMKKSLCKAPSDLLDYPHSTITINLCHMNLLPFIAENVISRF